MTAVPLLPKNAPFSVEEISVLNKVVSRKTALQRIWLAGFFAGFDAAQGAQAAPTAAARPRASLTVLYATASGNAEGLAIKAKILKLLDPLIVQYANQRNEGERFGDFMIRARFVTATLAGNRFHEKVKLAPVESGQFFVNRSG